MSDTIIPGEKYKPTLKIENNATRDAWLQQFSKYVIIGNLYDSHGNLVAAGKSALDWLIEFKILDANGTHHLTPEDLRELYVKIATAYQRAAYIHANYMLAAKALEGELQSIEGQLVTDEMDKYKEGGEYWDSDLRKPKSRRPGKEVLEQLAKAQTKEVRIELQSLVNQASFFANIMASLETQRRCLKDYAELVIAESSTKVFNV